MWSRLATEAALAFLAAAAAWVFSADLTANVASRRSRSSLRHEGQAVGGSPYGAGLTSDSNWVPQLRQTKSNRGTVPDCSAAQKQMGS